MEMIRNNMVRSGRSSADRGADSLSRERGIRTGMHQKSEFEYRRFLAESGAEASPASPVLPVGWAMPVTDAILKKELKEAAAAVAEGSAAIIPDAEILEKIRQIAGSGQ